MEETLSFIMICIIVGSILGLLYTLETSKGTECRDVNVILNQETDVKSFFTCWLAVVTKGIFGGAVGATVGAILGGAAGLFLGKF